MSRKFSDAEMDRIRVNYALVGETALAVNLNYGRQEGSEPVNPEQVNEQARRLGLSERRKKVVFRKGSRGR